MLVTFSPSLSAKIQPDTISANATAVIRSSRENGPNAARALRAATGASGVSPTRGGNSRAITQGKARIAVSAGTQEATNHFPKPIWIPYSRTSCIPIGFAEVAVIQRADDTARLAMVQNIR